ncbi:hypothetical protein BANT918_02830 [Brevibacterium antiquum CNRZ 918]|uniref:Uncharacterized protein n=1 Tax=Brevibacterium antiquum CNRZ 918 TaxID=1255637 RepID=A0A2H1KUU3_9MICO|nr:hypothetical protein BANT918_02830 [Brevibacterium antiquum CNRZ 918]
MPPNGDGSRFRSRCGNAVWRSRSPRGNGFRIMRRKSFTAAETRRTVDAGNPRTGSQVLPAYMPQRCRFDVGGLSQACGGGNGPKSAPSRARSWENLCEASSRAARRQTILVAQLAFASIVTKPLLRGPCHNAPVAALPSIRFASMNVTMTRNVAMTLMTAGTTVGVLRSSARKVGHRGCGTHRWTTRHNFEALANTLLRAIQL